MKKRDLLFVFCPTQKINFNSYLLSTYYEIKIVFGDKLLPKNQS